MHLKYLIKATSIYSLCRMLQHYKNIRGPQKRHRRTASWELLVYRKQLCLSIHWATVECDPSRFLELTGVFSQRRLKRKSLLSHAILKSEINPNPTWQNVPRQANLLDHESTIIEISGITECHIISGPSHECSKHPVECLVCSLCPSVIPPSVRIKYLKNGSTDAHEICYGHYANEDAQNLCFIISYTQ
jgi:hypothetical protein